MISNEGKGGWHYLAEFQNIRVIFIVWTVLIPLQQKISLSENKSFCGIVIPTEKNKILEFKQYMK